MPFFSRRSGRSRSGKAGIHEHRFWNGAKILDWYLAQQQDRMQAR
jgi:hypothetical protein